MLDEARTAGGQMIKNQGYGFMQQPQETLL
jgi:hypothetical protein